MQRRSFLKGLFGALVVAICPIPIPKIEEPVPTWSPKVGTNRGTLAGYKGKSQFEAGYIYCPYIPMTIVKGIK